MTVEARNGAAYAFYLGLTTLLLIVIAVGYLGFRQFAIAVMPHMGALNLLALAVIAGVAGFFSPCAFPLLPAYLSFYAKASGHTPQPSRPIYALRLGLAAAAGVVTFNLVLGLMIGLLGAGAGKALSVSGPEPSQFVRWFRAAVGLVLMGLGVMQWLNINLKPGLADTLAWQTRPNRESQKPAVTLYLYGLGYNAAGLTVFAFAAGGFEAAFLAFVIFSLTMGSLMLLVAGLVAASQETLLRRLKASVGRIKQAASVLLVMVGLFNVLTTLNTELFIRLLFP